MIGKTVLSVLQAIGNTPIVHLNKVVPSNYADVLVKLEYYNPTGSYKDRMALAMIEEAEKRGDLRPGMTVVEYTGGSTGSSLAFVCAVKGYRFRVVSSLAFAKEKLQTMSVFGAELNIVPSQGGQVTPDLVVEERGRQVPITRVIRGGRYYYCVTLQSLAAMLKEAGFRRVGSLKERHYQPLLVGLK